MLWPDLLCSLSPRSQLAPLAFSARFLLRSVKEPTAHRQHPRALQQDLAVAAAGQDENLMWLEMVYPLAGQHAYNVVVVIVVRLLLHER